MLNVNYCDQFMPTYFKKIKALCVCMLAIKMSLMYKIRPFFNFFHMLFFKLNLFFAYIILFVVEQQCSLFIVRFISKTLFPIR